MRKKHLAVVFETLQTNTIGNASRISIISYLGSIYQITIYTNVAVFLRDRMGQCRIVSVPEIASNRIPVISDIIRWKAIASRINSEEVDGVFMTCNTAPIALWLRKPCFQYVHQYGVRSNERCGVLRSISRNIAKRMVIAGLRRSQLNFVVSHPIMDLLRSKKVNNMVLMPHGVRLEDFREPCLTNFHDKLRELKNAGYFIVTYAGSVTENRGSHLMLESIRNAVRNDRKILFVVAGADDVHHEMIRKYGAENGITENLLSLGKVDVSLIPGILYFSDVCLSFLGDVPAHRLSPPQKVVEYFAASKPVIANNIVTHHLIQNGVNGYIVENDPEQIGAIITMLKNNGELLHELSANALETAKRFDFDHIYGAMVKQIDMRIGRDMRR